MNSRRLKNMRTHTNLVPVILILAISSPAARATGRLLLCGGVQVREGRVESVNGNSRFVPTWNWRPEESAGLPAPFVYKFAQVDDCKPSAEGKELLVSSSAGAVAVLGFPSGETRFYAAVPNAHSIALLPHGLVVAASSTHPEGNRLLLFYRMHSDHPIFTLPLEAAHGVVWDDRRNVLWALGDKELMRLAINPGNNGLILAKKYPIEGAGGHDLVMAQDGGSLFVTTSGRALSFDIGKESFSLYQPFAGLSDVKSVSVNPTTGQIAYTQADPHVWWTYTVRFLNPQMTVPLESHTYKVRWSTGRQD
jgi:hypothetical protein